jgi:hypothetical protein
MTSLTFGRSTAGTSHPTGLSPASLRVRQGGNSARWATASAPEVLSRAVPSIQTSLWGFKTLNR